MKNSLLIAFIILSSQLNAQNAKTKADTTQTKFIIRCAPTVIATEPLIIVDGEIMKGKNAEVIKELKPNLIRSIEVMKGASATAIYGAAGAAGVIIVNTKNKCEDKVIASEKCF